MNEKLLSDTLRTAMELDSNSESLVNNHINVWFLIALVELLLILYLLFFRKREQVLSTKGQFKKEAKNGEIDFGNIINSSFNVKPLYDELKVKCHPDRFPTDERKSKIALELFQEISKNKTNYKKLIELKELAKQNLNINF